MFKIPTPYFFFLPSIPELYFFVFFCGTPQFQDEMWQLLRVGHAASSRETEQLVLRTVYTKCKSEDENTFGA